MLNNEKFDIQDKEYVFPYHYLIDLKNYNNFKYLSWGLEYYSYMSFTVNYISQLNFSDLLDVGCGDGRLINELSQNFPERNFYGVDMSQSAIFLAKGLNYHYKNTSFVCQDFSQIQNQFDIVVLNEVLEHIPDDIYQQFCKNIITKMKKGGVLVITVPTKNYPLISKHFRHYNIGMIKNDFSDLSLEEIKYIFSYSSFSKYILAILSRIPYIKFIERLINKFFLQRSSEKKAKHLFVTLIKN